MSSTKINVAYVADLARLQLSIEEIGRFEDQLAGVLQHVEQLQKLKLDQIEPTAHGMPVVNVLRKDVVHESLSTERALANAPQQANNLIIMPKIVE